MNEFANLILQSGRTAVELALFVLLPVMIVMLSFMRLLEARGILDRIVNLLTPILRPLGIPGLGVFALFQVLFVSFAAPVATLAMMDKCGINRRHLAATLALVFAGAQANVVFPLSAKGLNGPATLGISALCAVIGAAATYHLFGRHLDNSDEPPVPNPDHPTATNPKGVLDVVNRAGAEAFNIAIGALPILVLLLLVVNILRTIGATAFIESFSTPIVALVDLPSTVALPIITKWIAGGTAMLGVVIDFLNQGLISANDLNRITGLMINPFDLTGISVLISAGPRVSAVFRPAMWGALIAIILRATLHLIIW